MENEVLSTEESSRKETLPDENKKSAVKKSVRFRNKIEVIEYAEENPSKERRYYTSLQEPKKSKHHECERCYCDCIVF